MTLKPGLFIALIFFSNGILAAANTFILKNDTLGINAKNCEIFLMNKRYYTYKQLHISSAFKIIDSIKLKNRNDLTVIVLSPMDQVLDGYDFPCNIIANRILLIYNDLAKDNRHVVCISDNLVFNKFDFSSEPYSYNKDAKSLNNGFNLYFNVGSATKCNLTLFFALKREKFYLRKYTTDYYSVHFPHSKSETVYLKIDTHNELNRITPMKFLHFPNWHKG